MTKEQKAKKKKIRLEKMAMINAMEFGIPDEKEYTFWEKIFDKKRIWQEKWKAYKKYEKEYLEEHQFDDAVIIVLN